MCQVNFKRFKIGYSHRVRSCKVWAILSSLNSDSFPLLCQYFSLLVWNYLKVKKKPKYANLASVIKKNLPFTI